MDYQQRAKSGRLDIVVGDDIGVELKLLYTPSQLKSLARELIYMLEHRQLK